MQPHTKDFKYSNILKKKAGEEDFLDSAMDRNPPANAGDTHLTPGQEDSTCLGAIKLRYNY